MDPLHGIFSMSRKRIGPQSYLFPSIPFLTYPVVVVVTAPVRHPANFLLFFDFFRSIMYQLLRSKNR